MSEDNDVKLSPEDITKCKKALEMLGAASSFLEDISDDVREEYGDLEDAISKVEEARELLDGVIPNEGEATGDEAA